MAKKEAVKEKYAGHKGPLPGMEIKMPSLPDKKKETSTGLPRDIQFLGEALVKETNRINELELSIESMRLDLKRIMNRMGL
tara:strand:- start:13545 stop:13787 length:243 start_codon:yes stop_codon:yes gene_type:complete